jgi:hypothetical protein
MIMRCPEILCNILFISVLFGIFRFRDVRVNDYEVNKKLLVYTVFIVGV